MAYSSLNWAISHSTILKGQLNLDNGAVFLFQQRNTYSSMFEDYNCKAELALTSDVRTIVCYHPSVDIPYEHTKLQPIPRLDPTHTHNHEETQNQVLKTRLEEKDEQFHQGHMTEQLSNMFLTTKCQWVSLWTVSQIV
nr:PREDICTED: 39S ribosomal protein L42, mitochondrial-like [Rhinolophus sinicus]